MHRRQPRPRRVGSEERAHLGLLRARARVAAAEQPPDQLEQARGRPPAPGRSGPGRAARALHRPRADARDRAQPPPGRARARVRAGRRVPRATSRATRRSASARAPPRSKDSSSAGAVPPARRGSAGRAGGPAAPSRSAPAAARSAARSPPRACTRSAARRSPTPAPRTAPGAGAPAATAAGAPTVRSAGRGRSGRGTRQVVVDAEREAHPRDRVLRGFARGWRERSDQHAVGGRSARRARPPAARRGAAAARARPRGGASRRRRPPWQPQRPAALELDAHLRRRASASVQPRPPSRCTSTSSERRDDLYELAGIGRVRRVPRPPARAPAQLAAPLAAAGQARTIAAPATKPPAATAAACTAGTNGAGPPYARRSDLQPWASTTTPSRPPRYRLQARGASDRRESLTR